MKDQLKMKLGVDVRAGKEDVQHRRNRLESKLADARSGNFGSLVYQQNVEAAGAIRTTIMKAEEEKLALKSVQLATDDIPDFGKKTQTMRKE